jgi:hypothetical protein
MGSGKTSVLVEASDLLTAANVPHAAIDFDMLAFGHWPSSAPDDLAYRNLVAVWNTFAAVGIDRVLISEAVDSANALDQVRASIPSATLTVCRLRASVDAMRERVRQREFGMLQQDLVDRVEELEAVIEAAGLEDFSVSNDGRSITDVAREVLERAGWIAPGTGRAEGVGLVGQVGQGPP